MRGKKLLVAFLLGVGLCFMSAIGQAFVPSKLVMGKVDAWREYKVSLLDYLLLEARVSYMMRNFDGYEYVRMDYDVDGSKGKFYKFPENVSTASKIVILIDDIRDYYSPSYLSLADLSILGAFEKQLNILYTYIKDFSTDMDNDVIALVRSKEGIKLAYFYQGEYHLWEK